MSSKQYATPLRLELRASTYLFLALLVMHVGAFLTISIIDIPIWLRLCVLVLIVVSAVNSLRKHAFRALPDAISQLTWLEDNEWVLVTKQGEQKPVRRLEKGFMTPWMTILNFVDENKRNYSVVLLPDNVNKDDFRQLRVRLRMDGNSVE